MTFIKKQIKRYKDIEDKLEKSSKRAQDNVNASIENAQRDIEIQNYYIGRFNAYGDFLRVFSIFFGFLLIFYGTSFNIIPSGIRNIIVTLYCIAVLIYLTYRFTDLSRRNNRYFNKYRQTTSPDNIVDGSIDNNSISEPDNTDISQDPTDGNGCVGDECCPDGYGYTYDSVQNKCVKSR